MSDPIPVVRLPPGDQWDQALLEEVLAGHVWGGVHRFVEVDGFQPGLSGAVVMLPARYYTTRVRRLNRNLRQLDWVVLLVTSDEESLFPVRELRHPNMRTWVMTPRRSVHHGLNGEGDGGRWLGEGWSPGTPAALATAGTAKTLDWFFAGQVNHDRRRACVEELARLDGGEVIVTSGFTQGLDRGEYLQRMAAAKLVPCPSGPSTPDSFRAYEALEAGCVPIVDGLCPAVRYEGYWPLVWGPVPFPIVEDWAELPHVIERELARWPANAVRCSAWWQRQKRSLATRLTDDITTLSGIEPDDRKVTVLMPTSPIASHPDTSFIEATIDSIRAHLDAEIIVMCDGVRPEQEHYRADYEEYLRRLCWLCEHEWADTVLVVHGEHLHQAEMTRRALDMVRTPTVMFVEHDTPLVTDEPIDLDGIVDTVTAGEVDVVRLHHEAHVLEPHQPLMLDSDPVIVGSVPVLRTIQWSQRPHVASTSYYRRILAEHFRPGQVTMIEDKMHSVAQCDPEAHRLAIYAPGPNLKRSLHLDGRGEDPKFDMDLS